MSITLLKFQAFLRVNQQKFQFYEELLLRILGLNWLQKTPYLDVVPIALETSCKAADEYLTDIEQLDDHILWAVPKSRKSVEKRRTKRIGSFNYVCKLIPLKKLQTCCVCGHPHEIGRLCPNCYNKIKEVSDAIKQAMIKSNGRNPIEHEYEPVFAGESISTQNDLHEKKKILEVPIERPSWFAKKLTQKSNVTLSEKNSVNVPNPTNIKIDS